jgi:hypothetical protein
MVNEYGTVGGIKIGRGNQRAWRKPAPPLLYQTWDRLFRLVYHLCICLPDIMNLVQTIQQLTEIVLQFIQEIVAICKHISLLILRHVNSEFVNSRIFIGVYLYEAGNIFILFSLLSLF